MGLRPFPPVRPQLDELPLEGQHHLLRQLGTNAGNLLQGDKVARLERRGEISGGNSRENLYGLLGADAFDLHQIEEKSAFMFRREAKQLHAILIVVEPDEDFRLLAQGTEEIGGAEGNGDIPFDAPRQDVQGVDGATGKRA